MKRIRSSLLTFGFVISSTFCVAVPPYDPVSGDNTELISNIRKAFHQSQEQVGMLNPYVFTENVSTLGRWWRGDYRTCRVYNFPMLVGNGVDGSGFLRVMAQAYTDAIDVYLVNSEIIKAAGAKAIQVFRDRLTERITGARSVKALMALFDADESTIIDSIICSFGLKLCAQAATVSGLAGVVWTLFRVGLNTLKSASIVGGVSLAAELMNIVFSKMYFSSQKAQNIAILIDKVYRILQRNRDYIDKTNVLVTAIDEGDPYPLPWNVFRSNHGAWAGFKKFDNLDCAPLGSQYRSELNELLQEYDRLFRNGRLCSESIREYVNEHSNNHSNCTIY